MTAEAKEKGSVFYGWWVIVACFMIYGFASIIVYGLTIYAPFILNDLHWTRADLGILLTAMTYAALFLGILAGRFIDRFGPRLCIIIGAAVGVIGVFLFSTITTMLQAFIYIVGILGISIIMQHQLPTTTLARSWFLKKAAFATGILMSSWGIIGAILFPLLTKLAGQYGWRPVMLWSGILIELLILILAVVLVRDNPEKMGLHMDGMSDEQAKVVGGFVAKMLSDEPHMVRSEALKTKQFWILSLGVGLVALVFLGFMTHITMIGLSVGMTKVQASLVMSAWALPSVIGRFGGGFVGDKIGKRKAFIIFGILSGLAYLFAFFFASSPTPLYIFAVLAGIVMSPIMVILPPFLGDLYGRLHLASILALFGFVQGAIAGMGSFIAGAIAHATNSYQYLFLLGAVSSVVFVGAVFLIKPTDVELKMLSKKQG